MNLKDYVLNSVFTIITLVLSYFFANIWFGIGWLLLIYIHEMGHFIVAKRLKYTVISFRYYILGGYVAMEVPPKNAKDDAFISIAGPIAGTMISIVFLVMYFLTKDVHYVCLFIFGVVINLFNLIPVHPLDGGGIIGAIQPQLGFLGILFLIYSTISNFNIWGVLLTCTAFVETLRMINRYYDKKDDFFTIHPTSKKRFTISYLTLLFLLLGIYIYVDQTNYIMPILKSVFHT